jgi:BioD-like phosphotransacetylase family protein
MKSIYITSIERYSGKTAACLALGRHFQSDGYKVGYLKPLSLQPWRIGRKIADEDATFVKQVLGLQAEPWELSPVVVTPEYLREYIEQGAKDTMELVKEAYEQARSGEDILLLEGGASLREGHAVGLPTPAVAHTFSSHVLVIVKFRSDIRVLDDALSAKARLGELLSGVIINRVPDESESFVKELAIPYLEERSVTVFGALPEAPALAALTVKEIIDVLGAHVLTENADLDAMVETLTVGAMTADAALHRFRKQMNKAVITGGDRTDIQLAALETSTTCLVLTGNLKPSPLIVKQAESMGVPVLLVPTNTMETIEKIEQVFGKSRLGQPAKLAQFEQLMADHVNIERIHQALGLSK